MTSGPSTGLRRPDSVEVSEYYRVASQFADAGLVVQNLSGHILWANPAYCSMMGYDLDEILGTNPLSFCMPPDQALPPEKIAAFQYDPHDNSNAHNHLYRNQRKDGSLFWNQIGVVFNQLDDESWICVLVCRDVSTQIHKEQQLRKTTAELERLATTDPLTGLANRAELTHWLSRVASRKSDEMTGLLQIDLDQFKTINDNHGHAGGDAILRHVATQLKNTIRPGDLAARIGGDEFVVICPDIDSELEIQIIGASIAQAMGRPLTWSQRLLQCQVSIGAAIAADGTTSPEELMRRADFALFEAKRLGRGTIAVYNHDLHERHVKEVKLSQELVAAVRADALTYFFQPTMSIADGQIVGFETLVRWDHPRLGLIPPAAFLNLAQRLGLMAEIDFGAVRAALRLKAQLNETNFEGIRVGLNGSAELLSHPDFFDRLMAQMKKYDIAPSGIVIEVLETVVFDDMTQTNPLVAIVKRLHDAGFSTLLDDFGTGHAGLSHLAKLAVTGVKIDRSLTTNIISEATSAKIIAMILDLCNDLGLYVVTEGIETVEEACALMQLGGTVMQGYWLSKPMPADEVIPWLQNRPDIISQIDRSAIAPNVRQGYLRANS